MSRGISLDQLQASHINKLNGSWTLKLELSRVSRLFHSTRMRSFPRANVTKYRKHTGYYGFRISCLLDFMSSRTLSISLNSPTQVPQTKPVVILIYQMPNLNTRDDFLFPLWVCGSNSTRLISVTELTRNDFQQKRLEGDLQHPSSQLRSAFRFGAYWWIRCAFYVFQFDFHPLLDSDPCK